MLVHMTHDLSPSSVSASHLFKSGVEQFEASRLPHGQTQAVDGVQSGAQEAAQPKLLPPGQPAVQPAGEAVVLGAPPQLEVRGAQTRQVDQRQHHQGHGGKGDVDGLDGHFVENTLPSFDEGMQDVPEEVVQVEYDEQRQSAGDGKLPGGKQVEGEVLDLQRGGEVAHVHGDEAHSATQLSH